MGLRRDGCREILTKTPELDERVCLTFSTDSRVLGGASAYTVLGVRTSPPAAKAAMDAATLYLKSLEGYIASVTITYRS